MLRRDYQDIIAGALMVVGGVVAALYAWSSYRLGTVSHMGPGMFPMGLSVLLAIIGAMVLVPALFRQGPALPKPDFRALVFVALALTAFSLTIRWLGLVPAIVLVTVLSVFADNKLGVVGTVVLATVLSITGWLIFKVGLGLSLETFRSPWR
jgi:uncharacterized BrkB/YihY/UPF0761 family membrane protein